MAAHATQPDHAPPTSADAPERPDGVAAPTALSMREHVSQILDLIRPAIQQDDGDIELVDVTAEGVVTVRFLGACIGCPSSAVTLQQGIERTLKEHIPEVRAVHPVA